jgi:Protein of unknown function (DUF2934)
MLFIHQQIQSFLHLGGCKEYSTMAKPKLPKKNNSVKETLPTSPSSSPDTISETKAVAAPVVEQMAEPQKAEPQKAEPQKKEARKTVRKPEIVKTEPRTNLVPINLEDEIRRLAYLLSERRGFAPGHDAEDWLAAEREVRQRYHQQSA